MHRLVGSQSSRRAFDSLDLTLCASGHLRSPYSEPPQNRPVGWIERETQRLFNPFTRRQHLLLRTPSRPRTPNLHLHLQVHPDAHALGDLDGVSNDAHGRDVRACAGALDDERALRVPRRVERDNVVAAAQGRGERVRDGVPVGVRAAGGRAGVVCACQRQAEERETGGKRGREAHFSRPHLTTPDSRSITPT